MVVEAWKLRTWEAVRFVVWPLEAIGEAWRLRTGVAVRVLVIVAGDRWGWLGQNISHDAGGFYSGQAEVEPLEPIGEAAVVDAE